MIQLREYVYEKVQQTLLNDHIEICNKWNVPFPIFMPVVLKLYDLHKKKIFTLEQEKEDCFEFDFAVRKTGIDRDELDLLLVYKDVESNIEQIIKIYKLWFIDNLDEEEMTKHLKQYVRPKQIM